MGAYLMKTCFQTTTVSSAMFITAMAANPLAVNLAQSAGVCVWGGVGGASGCVYAKYFTLLCTAHTPVLGLA